MNISQAAERSGVSSKAIRYYESINLITPARRSGNGYRDFSDDDVHMLRFVSRARGLGFSVSEVADLLALYQDRGRASAQVRGLAQGAIARIEGKITELQSIAAVLSDLVARCHGDDRPECPILDDLAGSR
ncbi:MAG: Cu(I)-responsive transcriptional regulator [Alphaproteobacteria bacterium]|jgi:MerR family copper efflux transcriptional regulator|nr:Cu(I)-responsive transcriptional regulator [Alphaproteobacteria bacterium]MDP6830254.1 Cu(I)-responsive transcriptional regulator [Alphaproteobacteria bacterium]MDP6873144.1 Cu(I)-responsive transcriptional regulator [Alphaproteobacteria bacterium]